MRVCCEALAQRNTPAVQWLWDFQLNEVHIRCLEHASLEPSDDWYQEISQEEASVRVIMAL